MPRPAKIRTPFAERLLRVRTTTGITQIELARLTKLAPRVIAHYETVGKNPPPDIAIRLAKALHITVDELLGLKSIPQKPPLLKNRRLLKKLKVLDQFSVEDQKKIMGHIDDIGTKYNKTK